MPKNETIWLITILILIKVMDDIMRILMESSLVFGGQSGIPSLKKNILTLYGQKAFLHLNYHPWYVLSRGWNVQEKRRPRDVSYKGRNVLEQTIEVTSVGEKFSLHPFTIGNGKWWEGKVTVDPTSAKNRTRILNLLGPRNRFPACRNRFLGIDSWSL
jgi:hypothetical protein